jgi:hypothetical protein
MTITLRSVKGSALTHPELDGNFTDLDGRITSIASTFAETVDDRVAALLVPGANVTLTYNDAANTLTVATTAGGGGGVATVRACAPANVTLSAPGAAIDGVTMVANDRFFAPFQTAGAEVGVYVWNGAAVAATRATDFDTYDEHSGALLTVQEGTLLADSLWLGTSNKGGTLGTTALAFSMLSAPDYAEAGTAFSLNRARVGRTGVATNAAAITATFDFAGMAVGDSGVVSQGGAGVVTLAGADFTYAPGVTASPTTAGQGGRIAWRFLGGTGNNDVLIEARSETAGGLPSAPPLPFGAAVLGRDHANAAAWLRPATHLLVGSGNVIGAFNSSGAGAAINQSYGPFGLGETLETGTTTTGASSRRFIHVEGSAMYRAPLKPKTYIEAVLDIETLSTAGEEFSVPFGFTTEWAFGAVGADAVFFEYVRGSSLNWRCITRAASTNTVTDSGVAVTAGTSVRLGIYYVSATEVRFYVNGALVATHVTNVPGDVNEMPVGTAIKKSAGTTTRRMNWAQFSLFREL